MQTIRGLTKYGLMGAGTCKDEVKGKVVTEYLYCNKAENPFDYGPLFC